MVSKKLESVLGFLSTSDFEGVYEGRLPGRTGGVGWSSMMI